VADAERLLNLGPKSGERLRAVGVDSYEALERLGSVEAYLRVDQRFPGWATKNLLYALEGALNDVRWDLLPKEERDRLAAELELRRSGPPG